jgi:hypothetical protein
MENIECQIKVTYSEHHIINLPIEWHESFKIGNLILLRLREEYFNDLKKGIKEEYENYKEQNKILDGLFEVWSKHLPIRITDIASFINLSGKTTLIVLSGEIKL